MMKETGISIDQLISHFEATLGYDGASQLIQGILKKAGLGNKQQFDAAEMTTICMLLTAERGFIATTASILLARLRLRVWEKRANELLIDNQTPGKQIDQE